ncbi:hypothetical protein [Pseudomonas poae]|uniref:hypothetical protein n=1 Tax=Pseudomonas poae TaxID=200451 RepID=UPI0030E164C3
MPFIYWSFKQCFGFVFFAWGRAATQGLENLRPRELMPASVKRKHILLAIHLKTRYCMLDAAKVQQSREQYRQMWRAPHATA